MTSRTSTIPARTRQRRDAAVVCPSCNRRAARKSRQQIYCSSKCRKRGNYARRARTGVISGSLGQDTGLGTDPPKNNNKFNALQWGKSRSSARIVGPRKVIEIEVFGSREWGDEISADGVVSKVGRLPAPSLIRGHPVATGGKQ